MPIRYSDAGVDIDAGEQLVKRIGPLAAKTRRDGVLSGVGGFAGLFRVPPHLREPVLVSGTDGVGTKLKIAFATGVHDTVGIDLVAMCVNDILTVGATPLFFLDYFGTGRLSVEVAEAVVRGIARGCELSGCALLGGETAELPGMYSDGEYDLAGFAVGVVEKDGILPRNVRAGDVLVAVPSSGLHSNGFSLARRVLLDEMKLSLAGEVAELEAPLGAALLEPTRIYASEVSALLERCGDAVHALAHITGGGVVDNLPRVLPAGLGATVRMDPSRQPPIFDLIARGGPVELAEMRRTFNLGFGLVAVVAAEAADDAVEALCSGDYRAWLCGEVHPRGDGECVEFV